MLGADRGKALQTAAIIGSPGIITLPYPALGVPGIILLALARLIRYLRR